MTKTLQRPSFEHENDLLAQGYRVIAGADEAGRGSLFGPVCVGMVVLPLDDLQTLAGKLADVRDSKQLPRPKVYDLAAHVQAASLAWAVGEASSKEIDKHGIMGGIALAVQRAFAAIIESNQLEIDYILGDKNLPVHGLPVAGHTILRGDATSYSISCGAILAKHFHDQRVRELARQYDPAYELDTNVGYGTVAHRTAIRKLGPTPHHRFSFRPVNQPPLFDLDQTSN
jgi:ribonuclease HII